MAIVPASKQKILSVGDVDLYRMGYSVTVGDAAEYPSQDALADDRFFRYYFNWIIRWRAVGGAASQQMDILLMTEGNSQTIWTRIWDSLFGSTGPTTPKDRLAPNEWWGDTINIQADFQPDQIIYPPGVAIRAGANTGNAGGQLDVRCIMAEAPDPRDLYPYINAQSGGISGPR